MGMGIRGNWEFIHGKNGNGIQVSHGSGNEMGMGMKSLKWERIGTKNLFLHISSSDICYKDL